MRELSFSNLFCVHCRRPLLLCHYVLALPVHGQHGGDAFGAKAAATEVAGAEGEGQTEKKRENLSFVGSHWNNSKYAFFVHTFHYLHNTFFLSAPDHASVCMIK